MEEAHIMGKRGSGRAGGGEGDGMGGWARERGKGNGTSRSGAAMRELENVKKGQRGARTGKVIGAAAVCVFA